MGVNSCVSRQTKDMVAKVKDQYDKYPSAISPLLESIHGISESFLQTLKEMGNEEEGEMAEDKYTTLNDLIRYNQSILKALQVSHPTLENILNVAEEHGLVGKLTGAGEEDLLLYFYLLELRKKLLKKSKKNC